MLAKRYGKQVVADYSEKLINVKIVQEIPKNRLI